MKSTPRTYSPRAWSETGIGPSRSMPPGYPGSDRITYRCAALAPTPWSDAVALERLANRVEMVGDRVTYGVEHRLERRRPVALGRVGGVDAARRQTGGDAAQQHVVAQRRHGQAGQEHDPDPGGDEALL